MLNNNNVKNIIVNNRIYAITLFIKYYILCSMT